MSDESRAVGAPAAGYDRSTLVAFFLMVMFAGGNAVAVRISNFGLPPFWGAAMRTAAAGLIFWITVALRRIALPTGRALLGAVLYGFLGTGLSFALMYWGFLRVPAGLGGAIVAIVPLMTLFLAWAHRLEAFRLQGLVGAVIATVGVLIGVAGWGGGAVHVPSLLALVAATAAVAESSIVFKLYPGSHPVATNAIALTVGLPVLVVLSLVAGEQWSLPATARTWAAYSYLVIVGSVGVFSLYLTVLSRWPATSASYSFLLIPVATVVLAAWLLGEPITTSFLIGAALVLVGVWVGAIRGSTKAPELVCSEMPNKALC